MPAAHLQTIDWTIIGSYFIALLVIGLYYRRFAARSMEDFFLCGRRNSGWASGVSYAAAMMNADVAPAYSGLTAVTGLFVCWWYLTRFGPALFIGAMLFAVFWRRLNLFTTPEFYEMRFGGLASNIMRTWVAIRSGLIAMVAWSGTGLLAMYKISGPVLGISQNKTMLIVTPIVLVYVSASGFAGVVATAGLQSVIMFVGSAMLCGIVLYAHGGPIALAHSVQHLAGSQPFDILPPLNHPVFPVAAALAYLLGANIGYGGDTAPMGGAMEGQHLLSSRTTREASKMYIVAEITLFVLLLLVTLPALGAIVQWPGLHDGTLDREQAYGLLMSKYLPPGMLGLLFVVMLAAVMSAVGGNLNFGAQVLVNDVYKRYLAPQRTDSHYVWMGRLATVGILALALVVAYKASYIFDVAVFMLGFSAAELPANWAQWWWWRFNRWGRLAASFGAAVILALVKFGIPYWHGWNHVLSDSLFGGHAHGVPNWPWWNQTFLVIGINTVFWVAVTLLTPPDSDEVLERFYLKARPLGAWGPQRRRTAETGTGHAGNRSGWNLIFIGMILALIGAGAIALMVLGLSHLYVGHYRWAALELVGFLLGGAFFVACYGRYIDRLEFWGKASQSVSSTMPPAIDDGSVIPSIWELRCTKCNYSLTGINSRKCPECGGAFDPRSTWEANHEVPTSQRLSGEEPVQPVRVSVVVSLSTVAYGLLLTIVGLIWTRGTDLVLNLVAGFAFLISAALVWWFGREPVTTIPETSEVGVEPASIP